MVSVTFLGVKFCRFHNQKIGKLSVNSSNFADLKSKTHLIFHATKLRGEGEKKKKEETLCSQIWLNLFWDDSQFLVTLQKLKRRKQNPACWILF
jgi:hypothetical protein